MEPSTTSPLREFEIVCFSNLDWDHLRYRKQHVMERLSAVLPVLYVNPPRAVKWRRPGRWNRERSVGPNLRVHDPIVLPGVRRWDRLREVGYDLIARRLEQRPTRRTIVWLYSPHALGFLDRLRHELVVYDMADDHTVPSGARVRPGERRELETLDALERRLLARADVVICASGALVDKVRSRGQSAHLVPNGCDFGAYAATDQTSRSATGASPRRPTIGYVGTLAPRFDFELVIDVARRRPDWDVKLVGPFVAGATRPVDAPANVIWAGEVPYRDVPATIRSFDVCILPLREIEFSYRSSPIQVFDYLAAGKPVVTTPVGQLEAMGTLVTVARGAAAFVEAIEASHGGDTPVLAGVRRAFARANSWDARVAHMLRILEGEVRPGLEGAAA